MTRDLLHDLRVGLMLWGALLGLTLLTYPYDPFVKEMGKNAQLLDKSQAHEFCKNARINPTQALSIINSSIGAENHEPKPIPVFFIRENYYFFPIGYQKIIDNLGHVAFPNIGYEVNPETGALSLRPIDEAAKWLPGEYGTDIR